MRVVSCMILLAVLSTTGMGCSLFKKNKDSSTGTGGSGGTAPAKFPGSRDPLLPNNVPPPPSFPATNTGGATTVPTSATTGNSILAGTIVDAYHRPVGNAYIRWVNLDEKDSGAPIDVAANANGHFIIQGVKPGTSYKLIARTKQGEKMLAGTTLTTAPNVRLVISIREDLANSSTPPLPNAPAYQGAAEGSSQKDDWNWGAPKTTPNDPLLGYGGSKAPAEPNLPATMSVPAAPTNTPVGNPPPPASNPNFVPGVVENPKVRLPMLSIPNVGSRPVAPSDPPRPPALAPSDSKLDTGPTRVPSCVLVGSHLENLALKDSNGQTWEYKKQGAGKMVLIDFWGTHCVYCRDSMPILNHLHTQYGSRGLEVIGIAMEPGKDERREIDAVNKQCAAMKLTYRQLMGHVGTFDAAKNFKVEGLPTLILLSEQGDIIYHQVGRPDAKFWGALERTIQSRLENRNPSVQAIGSGY